MATYLSLMRGIMRKAAFIRKNQEFSRQRGIACKSVIRRFESALGL